MNDTPKDGLWNEPRYADERERVREREEAWEFWRRYQERVEQARHDAEWQEVLDRRAKQLERTPEQQKYDAWYASERKRMLAERKAREARKAEEERLKAARAAAEQELKAKTEAEQRAVALGEKNDYEQWLRAQRDQQDTEEREKDERKRAQRAKAVETIRRRQAERAAAEAQAQAERLALATDSLDNYPDEDGKKYVQVELDDLEGMTERWEERHALDEAESGAYESAWWQHTENQREHAIVRMAQYHLERLAGKPLYQCPWSKMRLIGSRMGPIERW